MLAAASDAVVVLDESGRVMVATPGAEALWGFGAGDLDGQVFPGLRPAAGVLPDGSPEFVGVRRDGSEFDVEVHLSPVPTSDGALYIAVSVREKPSYLGLVDGTVPRAG